MNIILEGPDATGKSTLAEKLKKKFGMNIINSTSKTRNDFHYHIDLLDYQDNTVFDRFHVGEMVYPDIYGRDGKLSDQDFLKITTRIIENNDLLIVFYCSDINVLKERLIERGELNYLEEIDLQNKLFMKWIYVINAYEYKNFIAVDVSMPYAYDELDDWIDLRFGKISPNVAYRQMCRDLIEKGQEIETKTGSRGKSKELVNYMIRIDDLEDNVIDLKSRNISYVYLAGETLWYQAARNDVGFISKFGKLWEKISDDGITNNSAYGFILQKKHGFDQIEKIIELLKNDPSSRRAILNINVPNEHVIETKDEMCTICLNFMIRNNALDCTGVMRSNDIVFGFTYDFSYFTQLQKYIASRLGIRTGSYTHFAMSLHFYERDYQLIKDIAYGTLERKNESFDIDNLLSNANVLIDHIDNRWEDKEVFEEILKEKLIIRRR